MPERSKKRPRDPNQLAYQIMLESTGQAEKFVPEEKPKLAAAVELGRLGGLKGGPARAAALSPQKRSQIAAKAAAERWSKTGPQPAHPLRKPTYPDNTKTQYPLQKPAKVPPPPPPKKK